jgi:hypothetical protein
MRGSWKTYLDEFASAVLAADALGSACGLGGESSLSATGVLAEAAWAATASPGMASVGPSAAPPLPSPTLPAVASGRLAAAVTFAQRAGAASVTTPTASSVFAVAERYRADAARGPSRLVLRDGDERMSRFEAKYASAGQPIYELRLGRPKARP